MPTMSGFKALGQRIALGVVFVLAFAVAAVIAIHLNSDFSFSWSRDKALVNKARLLVTPSTFAEGPEIQIAKDCIFYDQPTRADDHFGRTYAIMIANLLGHFPKYQTSILPIENYRSGELDRCYANFYVVAKYENRPPKSFYRDVVQTKSRMVWIGSAFWNLGPDVASVFGVNFKGIESEDRVHLDKLGHPSFFQDVLYKGEVFSKLSEMSNTVWEADPEIARVEVAQKSKARVLAEIQHNASGTKSPWAVQKDNYFLFTEIPFSYVHEGDRYFVFADLLFDILQEQPRRKNAVAIVRFEDIHALTDANSVREALSIAKKDGVKPIISIIPVYRDPLNNQESLFSADVPIADAGDLLRELKKYQASGGVIGWHGVTHQYGDQKNPSSGKSGEDYEFWDDISQTPIRNDSTSLVTSLLQRGALALADAGLSPHTWITPHYKSSGLDSLVFSHSFDWTIGRQTYFDITSPHAAMTKSTSLADIDRLKFDLTPGHAIEQLYPYEIDGDFYGQRLIPEDLGNVQLTAGAIGRRARTVPDILADAKRLRVLRDVWASFFYHPFLLDVSHKSPSATARGAVDLNVLLEGIHALGYDFIDLNEFMTTQLTHLRPPIQDGSRLSP